LLKILNTTPPSSQRKIFALIEGIPQFPKAGRIVPEYGNENIREKIYENYRIVYRITDIKIPLDTGDFRLIDRKALEVLKAMREHHRFPRGMAAWVGFRQIGVPYKRAARFSGVTKYPFRKMIALALNAITGFSYFPLQLATYFGFLAAGLAIIAIPLVIILRMTGTGAFLGQATTLIAVLFLGGVQLISLGLIGEYIGRIYDEVKGRPLYIVREAPKG
jgi:glycosyltransferase involved in cell wall biosynthesis